MRLCGCLRFSTTAKTALAVHLNWSSVISIDFSLLKAGKRLHLFQGNNSCMKYSYKWTVWTNKRNSDPYSKRLHCSSPLLLFLVVCWMTVLSHCQPDSWLQNQISLRALKDSLFLSNRNYDLNFQQISLGTSVLPWWAIITIHLSYSASQQRKLLCWQPCLLLAGRGRRPLLRSSIHVSVLGVDTLCSCDLPACVPLTKICTTRGLVQATCSRSLVLFSKINDWK